MQTLFDFLPILVFFICFKLFGIYVATASAMCASFIQVLIFRIRFKKFDKIQLFSMFLILILGGLTLFFHNPWFIKWKPTVIYWLTAIVLGGSKLFSSQPLIQKMLEKNIQLPHKIWQRLNLAWIGFFSVMGAVNILVAYEFDTNTWVNFKLFGVTSVMVVFILIQAYFLTKHYPTSSKSS